MRIVPFFLLFLCPTAYVVGQVVTDSTGNVQTDTAIVVPIDVPEEPHPVPIPSSFAELLYRTQQGEFDPVKVIGEMVNRGSGIVDTLRKILLEVPEIIEQKPSEGPSTETEPNQALPGIDILGLQRMRIYALIVLEAMNKPEAYTLIGEVATSHSDKEVRGIALNALGTSMHEQMTEETPPPAKELIYLLLRNADDTTRVEFLTSTIGEIARRGLENWTGKDYGEMGDPGRVIKVGEEKTEMTIQKYRDWWWERSKDRLTWDAKEKMFNVQ